MDADEFIHPTDRFGLALFKLLLPMEKNIAFGLKIEPAKEARKMSMAQSDILTDQKEDDYQTRIFPKNTGVQFQGKVFEDLDETLNEKQVQVLRNDVVKITHNMEGREKSDKRKIPAIAKSFDSIHDPQKILKAGILFLRLGDFESAYPWLIKAAGVDPNLSAKIGMLYSNQNKLEMAKEILTSALKLFPDSSKLILSMAEVYYKEENYNEVINILANRIEAIDKDLESEDAAKAAYYHGISSLETGNLGDGIEFLAFAHEKNPANMLYKIAGVYAFSKVDQWEDALQAAAQIAEEEVINISGEVNDFVDVGRIFVSMNHHFAQAGKSNEAYLCQKITEDIIKTKITGEEDIERMSAVIETVGS
jgi:tetratricopeptide (TPR) repeat protein